jgi:polyisoprenyl-teichoic acid--peptidoglycan teichoic acid transferase
MHRLGFLLVPMTLILMTVGVHAQDATAEPIPDAMPVVDEGDQDIVNILLLGSATNNSNNPGLSDSLLVVSVNRTVGTVSVVSIPRDLYVYEPGFGMQKINTAYYFGETQQIEGGGIGLLEETIRYNLGLKIDFYARVDFNGFSDIIDAVGGINITVDCIIQDWKLKSPELDKQDPKNYEMFRMDIGLWHMDSDLALWYVRSRKTSSDLDRGRRQQDVLRALWRKIRASNMLETLPQTWDTLTLSVTTDMTLADVLGMSPLALSLDTSDIQYYRFRQKHEVHNAVSPAGQDVLVMERDAVAELMQDVVLPPNASRVRLAQPTIAIVNASGYKHLDLVAADRLELEGFHTVILDEPASPRNYNHIVDYTGATKGSPIKTIQDVLRVTDDGVEVQPDPNRQYDFKVYIGSMYSSWTCTRDVIQPTAVPTEATPGM